ncbi:hypothetical protein JL720_11739 [Aureococcus anophagefferens]|nr:hypothetical protein JL720_11739 [Aureococcus anophagefferens]
MPAVNPLGSGAPAAWPVGVLYGMVVDSTIVMGATRGLCVVAGAKASVAESARARVEYATKAVENAGTVVGMKCKDGVVLGVEKVMLRASPRTAARSSQREECDNYEEVYGIPIRPAVLAQRLSEYVHYFTIHGALRPFGTSTMIAAYDEREKAHQLYVLEPTGVCLRYFGAALGKGRQSAKSEIEKLDLTTLTCRDALKEIAKMIYTCYDESKDKPFILEMAWLCEETKFEYQLVPQDLIDAAETWAKKELEEDDDDDDDDEMAS